MRKAHIYFGEVREGTPTIPLAAALGKGDIHKSVVGGKRFNLLQQRAFTNWETVDGVADADLVVYPHVLGQGEESRSFEGLCDTARGAGLPCLLFLTNECLKPTQVEYGAVYRYSAYRSALRAHERTMPALTDDMWPSGTEWYPAEWCPEPTVGFCGYVGSGWHRWLMLGQGRVEKARGLFLRADLLTTLEAADGVNTNFIRRRGVWGDLGGKRGENCASREVVRRQFQRNIVENMYTLAPRGKGNYSFRLMEVLSAGRIPIVPMTDLELPFADVIDWKRHAVLVPGTELASVTDCLHAFHRNVPPGLSAEIQRANRKIWKTYLEPWAAYCHITERHVGS